MSMNKEQEEAILGKPFEVSKLKPFLSEYAIKGYHLEVFLKDEEAVDEFAKWFKKEILKIKN